MGSMDPGGMPPLYQAVVEAALADGQELMATLVQATGRGFCELASLAVTHQAAQKLKEAEQYLEKYQSVMVVRFPAALQSVISQARSQAASRDVAPVQFDQLELMDEAQVQEQVVLGRAQLVVLPVVQRSFSRLAPLMSALSGSTVVSIDRNPLRPDMYIRAVLRVVNQMRLPVAVHQEWMTGMNAALGPALTAQYTRLASSLLDRGVKPLGATLNPTYYGFNDSGLPQVGDSSASRSWNPMDGMDQITQSQAALLKPVLGPSTLTLNRLRMLLSGELTSVECGSRVALFAQKFALEFDAVNRPPQGDEADFDVTVPAAFEVLQEMQQVDQVIQRIGDRNAAGLLSSQQATALEKNRSRTHLTSRDLGQALSLEVVSLMIDNMVNGTQLLGPVKEVIKTLESALLDLAETDPRFFSNKLHPARLLLQEITQRSLAFETTEQAGFDDFMASLRSVIAPLLSQPAGSRPTFQATLDRLILILDEVKKPEKMKQAVHALQRADERHLVAVKIASSIRSRSDVSTVPAEVVGFLCGPWSQVVAHARLESRSARADPGQYGELIDALLWSVRPELTRKDPAKFTRLLPKLWSKLRQGLASIDYPQVQSSAFFAVLMGLHQQAFRPRVNVSVPVDVMNSGLSVETGQDGESDPWLEPREAQASGFIALAPSAAAAPVPGSSGGADRVGEQGCKTPSDDEFAVGVWVEIVTDNIVTRTQLTWTNPKGTMFLFTSANGASQSMTRRSRDQMLLANTMKLVSGQHVLDDALNAVAQTALHNSIDLMP